MLYKLRIFASKIITSLDRKLYGKNEFVVISNNCWGAEIYKRLGIQYNTPFVGLFICGPDYIKLLSNLDYYLNCPLSFATHSKYIEELPKYPIGRLEELEIHFVHYKDEQDALNKWTRRLERMKEVHNRNHYFFKVCDRDFATIEDIKQFHQLPFKHKISFSSKPLNLPNHYQIKVETQDGMIPDGVGLYHRSFKYIDLLKWVNTGKKRSNLYSKIKALGKVS